jgi:hypothetical protein
VDPNGGQPSYFVLTYDSATGQVLSLSGHGHDFTGAVLTLTARIRRPAGDGSGRRRHAARHRRSGQLQ